MKNNKTMKSGRAPTMKKNFFNPRLEPPKTSIDIDQRPSLYQNCVTCQRLPGETAAGSWDWK